MSDAGVPGLPQLSPALARVQFRDGLALLPPAWEAQGRRGRCPASGQLSICSRSPQPQAPILMPAVQEAGSRRKSPSTGKAGVALRPRRGEAEQGAAMFMGSRPTRDPRPLAAWKGRDAELGGNGLVFHSRPLEV